MTPETIRLYQRAAINGDGDPDGILELCSEILRLRDELQAIGTDKHLADCPKQEHPTVACACHRVMALEALLPTEDEE